MGVFGDIVGHVTGGVSDIASGLAKGDFKQAAGGVANNLTGGGYGAAKALSGAVGGGGSGGGSAGDGQVNWGGGKGPLGIKGAIRNAAIQGKGPMGQGKGVLGLKGIARAKWKQDAEDRSNAEDPSKPGNAPEGENGSALAGEDFYDKNKKHFGGPTETQNYWEGIQGKYGGAGKPVTNRAEEAYQQFQASQPADMSPYYANARKRQMEDIDRSMAARGMYGSGAATNQIARSMENLGAQEAKDNAQYGLQRGQLAGNLGRGADISSAADSQNEQGWQRFFGDSASAADRSLESRLGLGYQMASGAQNLYQDEMDREFQRNFAQQQSDKQMAWDAYKSTIQSDRQLMDAVIGGQMGLGQSGVADSRYNEQNTWNDAQNIMSIASSFGGGAGGGGGGASGALGAIGGLFG